MEPSQEELEAGPPAPKYIPGPPPPSYIPAPPPKKKGRARRALEAVAKPFKAAGAGLKKLGKRLKRGKKKGKVTAAELTGAAYAPPVEEPAAKYAAPLPYTAAPDADGGAAPIEEDETTISEDLAVAPIPLKYLNLASVKGYKTEAADSSAFINDTLLANNQLSGDMIRHKVVPPGMTDAAIMTNPEMVKFGLKKVWGWSDKDIATYYDFGKNKAKASKVNYIRSEADLKKFVVHAGATVTYGDPPQVFDTAGMVSKASGPGFAIFVMDENGNIFAGQHRVGLFHHSSFTAGLPVAAAGEIKVTGGALEGMTSKSGHYTPSAEQTWQAVQKMAALGVSFATAEIRVWREDKTDYYRGTDFVRRGPAALVVKSEGRWK